LLDQALQPAAFETVYLTVVVPADVPDTTPLVLTVEKPVVLQTPPEVVVLKASVEPTQTLELQH
jgi:hypothetical protein